ncbi:MAG: CcmD family protein [Flavobacteriales bacterium]|nr:CcmD family protein [Flavobacteriales bacterium]
MKIRSLLSLSLTLLTGQTFAQTKENLFYSNGKIYVVVAVISIIFTGIVTYLILLDRRLKRTEKELRDKFDKKGSKD